MIAPFAGTLSKFLPDPWGTEQVSDAVKQLLDGLAAEPPPDAELPPDDSAAGGLYNVPPVSGGPVGPAGGASGTGGGTGTGGGSSGSGDGSGGGTSDCRKCSTDADCEAFFVSVCNSCGRGGARCEEYAQQGLCCQCPRCITTDSP